MPPFQAAAPFVIGQSKRTGLRFLPMKSGLQLLLLGLLLAGLCWGIPLFAQAQAQNEAGLQSMAANPGDPMPLHPEQALAVVFCAAFCALWAENTGRNPWLWFALGLLFSVLALVAVLYTNSRDKPRLEPITS